MRTITAIVLLTICGSWLLWGQTPVTGTIDTAAVWKKEHSPYIITGTLLVAKGGSLTINAGVTVTFSGNHAFVVNGRLRVSGSVDDSVRFRGALGDSDRVLGIQLNNGSLSTFRYAVIEGFRNGVWAFNGSVVETLQSVMLRNNVIGFRSESPLIGQDISGEGNGIGMQFNGAVTSIRRIVGVRFERNSVGIECSNSEAAVRILDGAFKFNQTGISVREGNFFGQRLDIQRNDSGIYVRGGSLTLRSSVLAHHAVVGADNSLGSVELIEDTVEFNTIGILSRGETVIASCLIRNNSYIGADLAITDHCTKTQITQNGSFGIIARGSSDVQYCVIEDNDSIGVYLADGSPFLQNSSVAHNGSYGVMESDVTSPTVRYNNIMQNGRYDLIMTTKVTDDFDAANNYWGTTDLATIQARIFDQGDAPLLKRVIFSPYGLTPYQTSDNALPTMTVARTVNVKKDTVLFTYQLSDAEKNILAIHGEFRTRSGQWLPMTVTGKSTGIQSTEYSGTIKWITGADLPHQTAPVLARWRAVDQSGLGYWDTLTVHVDNNSASSVVVNTVTGTLRTMGVYRDTLTFSVTVTDAESDSSTLRIDYRLDSAGTQWKQGTIAGNMLKRPPGQRSLAWNTAADIPSSPGQYRVRIVPFDFKEGRPDSLTVTVDNYGVATITLLFVPSQEDSGSIRIPFSLHQYDPHTVSIEGHFSTDGGSLWMPATLDKHTASSTLMTFNDTVIWNTRADLPSNDRSGVWFRMRPFNPVYGISGTVSGIHIDNNLPPVSDTVRVQGPRVSGDVAVTLAVKDVESDTFALDCEFFVDSVQGWRSATISAVTIAADTCRWYWRTDVDLYNQDRLVRLRARASDNDPGNQVVSAWFRVDNVKGPRLVTVSRTMMLTDDSLRFAFDRPIRATSVTSGVSIASARNGTVPYSVHLNAGGDRLSLHRPGRFPAFDTITVRISADPVTGLRDTSGNAFDGDKDEELEGAPIDDTVLVFHTSLLGDYDLDGEVGVGDLTLFRTYWTGKRFRYELGPADGTPPFMQTVDDGVMDIEDLMVFIRNWNWSVQRRIPSMVREAERELAGAASPATRWDPVSGMVHRYQLRAIVPDAAAAEYIVRYPTNKLRVSGWHSQDAPAEQQLLTLAYHDSVAGILVLSLAHTGEREGSAAWTMPILELQPLVKEGIAITVSSSFVTNNGDFHRQVRQYRIEDRLELPTSYGMEQNFPNPFNPKTTIRYQLPEGGRVLLEIFNLLGQRVSTVVDAWREAGFHAVDVNGASMGSGVYLYRLSVNGHTSVQRMVLLK